MALLAIVLAVAAPSLAPFFRGRGLDAEARRLLALTRYGQSRAVSEGVPMLLWIDEEQGRYGLEAERSYLDDEDLQAKEFQVSDRTRIEVAMPASASTFTLPWKGTGQVTARQRVIRFLPTGFIQDPSPEFILLTQVRDEVEEGAVLLGRSRNRLNYEILTNQLIAWRR